MDFTFCPSCGNTTLQWDFVKKWNCTKCNFVLYNNVAGAVAVIIRLDDTILFTRRNQEPKKGKLDLAGGFIDPHESAEHACKRELWEELQLDINPNQLKYITSRPNVYQYKNVDYHTIDLFYEYTLTSMQEITLEVSEVSEIVWIKKDDIPLDDIAFDSQKEFFKNY